MNAVFDHPAARRIAIACVAVVLFAGIVAVAAHSGDTGGVGDARLTTKGKAAVTGTDGRRREVTGTVALHRGETVEAVEGAMTIELPDGSTVEGRPSFTPKEDPARTSDATRVKIAQPVELLGGELLVTSPGTTQVDAGGNVVNVEPAVDGGGAARVSRSVAVAASAYRGGITLDSGGQKRAIPALRTMEVSVLGRPPASPSPITLFNDDQWDRRFLGAAMDLGDTLQSLSSSYTNSIGGNPRTPGYYRQILPSLADHDELTTDLMNESVHTSGETLVGGAIAGLSRRSSFVQQWREVFAFRDAGATWGLVALDQGVAFDPLLTEVRNAVSRSELAFANVGANQGSTTSTSPPATSTPGSTSTTTPGGPTTTAPPEQPPPTTLAPLPPTGSPVVDGLVQDVNELLGGLLGGRPPGG